MAANIKRRNPMPVSYRYFRSKEQVQGDLAHNEKNYYAALRHYQRGLDKLEEAISDKQSVEVETQDNFATALSDVISETCNTTFSLLNEPEDNKQLEAWLRKCETQWDLFEPLIERFQRLWVVITAHRNNLKLSADYSLKTEETAQAYTYQAIATASERISDSYADQAEGKRHYIKNSIIWMERAIKYLKKADLTVEFKTSLGYLYLLEKQSHQTSNKNVVFEKMFKYIKDSNLLEKQGTASEKLELHSYALLVASSLDKPTTVLRAQTEALLKKVHDHPEVIAFAKQQIEKTTPRIDVKKNKPAALSASSLSLHTVAEARFESKTSFVSAPTAQEIDAQATLLKSAALNIDAIQSTSTTTSTNCLPPKPVEEKKNSKRPIIERPINDPRLFSPKKRFCALNSSQCNIMANTVNPLPPVAPKAPTPKISQKPKFLIKPPRPAFNETRLFSLKMPKSLLNVDKLQLIAFYKVMENLSKNREKITTQTSVISLLPANRMALLQEAMAAYTLPLYPSLAIDLYLDLLVLGNCQLNRDKVSNLISKTGLAAELAKDPLYNGMVDYQNSYKERLTSPSNQMPSEDFFLRSICNMLNKLTKLDGKSVDAFIKKVAENLDKRSVYKLNGKNFSSLYEEELLALKPASRTCTSSQMIL